MYPFIFLPLSMYMQGASSIETSYNGKFLGHMPLLKLHLFIILMSKVKKKANALAPQGAEIKGRDN